MRPKIFLLLIIIFLGCTCLTPAISQNNGLFTTEEFAKANTTAKADYLTTEEKEVVRYLNLARTDGKKFFDSYIQSYIDKYNTTYTPKIKENNKYVKSLKNTLYKIKGLPFIYPNEKLHKAALYHAKDMGKTGKTGHNSSNGNSFVKRLKKLTGLEYNISENCDYGFDKGLDIVCHLLIDNGIPSLGHRENILNAQQRYVGVSIQNHKIYEYNCVMDFYSGQSGL